MFKSSVNPNILELTKSHRGRQMNLSKIDTPLVNGKKACAWCLTPLKGRQYKWCSAPCSQMAWAWANPQKEAGLHVLLARQNFTCSACDFDYMPYVVDALRYINKNGIQIDPSTIKTQIHERLTKILKYKVPYDRLPEVDHILPVSKGGQGIGFENHQALCYTCHKIKTRLDNSGPRAKKTVR